MFGSADTWYKTRLMQRESDRKKKEGLMTGRLAELESTRTITQKAEFEGSTQAACARALMKQDHLRQGETQLAHSALILVRREALRSVLEQESELYRTELSQRGLAIYQKRI